MPVAMSNNHTNRNILQSDSTTQIQYFQISELEYFRLCDDYEDGTVFSFELPIDRSIAVSTHFKDKQYIMCFLPFSAISNA